MSPLGTKTHYAQHLHPVGEFCGGKKHRTLCGEKDWVEMSINRRPVDCKRCLKVMRKRV